jgi:hypothetical protein
MTTTISSSSFGSQRLSPREMLQNTLASQVSTGEVSASDQSALSSALDTIDAAMKAERGSFSATRTAPPSPDEAKAKIDSLIAEQVEAGTLTEDQAAELKEIFMPKRTDIKSILIIGAGPRSSSARPASSTIPAPRPARR